MKVNLMNPDEDFDPLQAPPSNANDLVEDLGLNQLFSTMAQKDSFVEGVVRTAILCGLQDPEMVQYRQAVVDDFLHMPTVLVKMYSLVCDVIERKREGFLGLFSTHPSSIAHESIRLLTLYLEGLKDLRIIADEHISKAQSGGLKRFFAMLQDELSDEYLDKAVAYLNGLPYNEEMVMSVQLGKGHIGTHYTLVQSKTGSNWLGRTLDIRIRGNRIHVAAHDQYGLRALSDMKDRGLNVVANALAQSAEHILSFLTQLKAELAFFVGCLNLYTRLCSKQEPTCFPFPSQTNERKYLARGLYDISLSLSTTERVVGNDVDADGKELWVVTGANQGGKSTFLRSVGVAQMMMQSGMFVAAQELHGSLCSGIFTHFRREEDHGMNHGKFVEELNRMDTIVDQIQSNSLLLLNESFASTSEIEGVEIAIQLVRAFVEHDIRIVFVTHMYEFGRQFYEQGDPNILFLRAGRNPDGSRSFRIQPGTPLTTSFGRDLYDEIFAVNNQIQP